MKSREEIVFMQGKMSGHRVPGLWIDEYGLMNMDSEWIGDEGYIQSWVFQGSWPNIALLRGWGFSFFYS